MEVRKPFQKKNTDLRTTGEQRIERDEGQQTQIQVLKDLELENEKRWRSTLVFGSDSGRIRQTPRHDAIGLLGDSFLCASSSFVTVAIDTFLLDQDVFYHLPKHSLLSLSFLLALPI